MQVGEITPIFLGGIRAVVAILGLAILLVFNRDLKE